MSLGIECLLAEEPVKAFEYATELDQLNRDRREIETAMKQQAEKSLAELYEANNFENLPVGICLYDAAWHQGVVGILASRIREKYHRPVIIFAAADDGLLKGSGRSIKGLHLRDLLDLVAKRKPGLIKKFGGHAMAAGLTLAAGAFAEFESAFLTELDNSLDESLLDEVIYTDGSLGDSELELEFAQLLQQSGPWGQAFPEPVFTGEFSILKRQIVGENHLRMSLRARDQSKVINAIAFNQADQIDPYCDSLKLVYRLCVNDFNGTRTAQLVVDYAE